MATKKRKFKRVRFDGRTFESELDQSRLATQLIAVTKLMKDGQWRTLEEIGLTVKGTIPAISARLRDLRKDKFGGHTVERRRASYAKGLFEYKLIVNK